jgi:hypothetical protein
MIWKDLASISFHLLKTKYRKYQIEPARTFLTMNL